MIGLDLAASTSAAPGEAATTTTARRRQAVGGLRHSNVVVAASPGPVDVDAAAETSEAEPRRGEPNPPRSRE